MPPTKATPGASKQPLLWHCDLCPKRFTRRYNLLGHRRTHTDERPFLCAVCGKAFARQHDRKVHEGLHSGEKKFVCKGDLEGGQSWGCGRRFALGKNLGRHFRSEKGRACIKPLLDEEMSKRQQHSEKTRQQARGYWDEVHQQSRQKTVSTEPAGSLPTTEQDRHLPPPEQNLLYHEPGESIGYPPMPWMANQGEQRSSLQNPLPQSSITAPPTKDEAFRAANILRRYLQHPDRPSPERTCFLTYLERHFDSDAAANKFLSAWLGAVKPIDI